MTHLHQLLSQLGLGGGLLFGLPLVLIGATLRGLARRALLRLEGWRAQLRKLDEIDGEAPVTLVGQARREPDGRLVLVAPGARAKVALEVDHPRSFRDGVPLVVHGVPTRDDRATGGYRDDARAWLVDGRLEDAGVLRGTLDGGVRRMRLQVFSGGLVFAIGCALVAATGAAALVASYPG